MKVIAINGSPRVGGDGSIALNEAFRPLRKTGLTPSQSAVSSEPRSMTPDNDVEKFCGLDSKDEAL